MMEAKARKEDTIGSRPAPCCHPIMAVVLETPADVSVILSVEAEIAARDDWAVGCNGSTGHGPGPGS